MWDIAYSEFLIHYTVAISAHTPPRLFATENHEKICILIKEIIENFCDEICLLHIILHVLAMLSSDHKLYWISK